MSSPTPTLFNLLTQIIAASGDDVVFPNDPGGEIVSFNLILSGAPTSSSIVIAGTLAGVDTILDTYTGNVTALRNLTVGTVYDSFKVTATWVGGTSVEVVIDCTITTDATIVNTSLGNPYLFPVTIALHGDYNFAHGLGAFPNEVIIQDSSNGRVRFQNIPFPPWDETYVYLNSSDDGLVALVMVEL